MPFFTVSRFTVSHRLLLVMGIVLLLISTHPAFATQVTSAGADSLPFDTYLTKIRTSVSGPFAFAAAIIGLVGAGAALIFGGEMNGFLRSLIFAVLVVSFIVTADSMLTAITGKGAEIASLSHNLIDLIPMRWV
ncbi:TrbC/VirB2 family protein [Candidatus Fukatsuia symbiotica]|uniref:Conjugal transfer protein n=1 Tax=Candidatus Fukatsuia symbiotica TaxID=1878942 RepID=A0A2U8I7A2_9GAMM|nr:TrbC/VirB2 family protein [Candidatus Fukatsuia symbiotica]AWK15061.1 conjugal transfer protein [Candidatus Fukatsuia symbiotica]MEA9443863.1 TrbC/VirB2 family protein [Candidatus Fukatsuia symbiotica]